MTVELFVCVALVLGQEAPEPRIPWLVLPVQGEKAAPKDPTGLRLTKTIGEAIHEAFGEDVRIASRDVRDEHCPQEDGQCPGHVAEMVGAVRAVSLVLQPDFKGLVVRVFKGTSGLENKGEIPCVWEDGSVRCETKKLAALLKHEGAHPPLDAEVVKKSFDALRPKLERCKLPRTNGASVSFRVRPDGHVGDVRIQPDELQDDPAYACVARTVESLRLRPFTGDKPEPFRFDLAADTKATEAVKSEKSKVDRKKKSR